MNFEELSQSLNLSSRFLQLLATRFNIDNELDLINAANEAQAIKEEVGEDATEEDIVDFMEVQREVASPAVEAPVSEADTMENQETVAEYEEDQPEVRPVSPQVGVPQPQPSQPIQERATVTQAGELPQFQYDPKNTRATGKTVAGGTNEVINRMFGTDATISQEYARYNPKLEPRSGINWGTDFVPKGMGVGAQMSNPFDSELKVLKVVDGYGSGGVGRFDQNGGYGNQVIVQRTDTGEIMKMSHLQKGVPVQEGQVVKPGEVIARMGDSGNVTGAHLDLEVFDADGRIKDVASLAASNAPKQAESPSMIQALAKPQEQPVSAPQMSQQPKPEPVQPVIPQQQPAVQRIQQVIQPQQQSMNTIRALNAQRNKMQNPYQKALGRGGGFYRAMG